MNEFFENAGGEYEVPRAESNYMKFEQGDNKFRILEKPIFGWEGWKEGKDGKDVPVRFKFTEKPENTTSFRDGRINHFWAMPVWNFRTERVEVLEITQKRIQQAIESLAKDEDWGSPLGYNLNVKREGEKLETKYMVNPAPNSEVPEEATKAFKALKDFDITRLYDGGDPFNPDSEKREVADDKIGDADIPF